MVGSGTGSLAGILDVYHEPNTTVCSILSASGMCSMAAIEHLAWVAPLDKQKMGVFVFELTGIVLTRDCWDQCNTTLLEYVARHAPLPVGK